MKQDSKYLQPRWCPSGLSHTQKRMLQRNAQARIDGATSRGQTNKASSHEKSLEAEANYFIINLK